MSLINNPPKGYEFIINNNEKSKNIIKRLKASRIVNSIYQNIIKRFFNVFGLINNFYYKESPEGTNLILSTVSIVEEKKPWIMKILDDPFCLGGNDYRIFMQNRKRIERALESPYCKRIIVNTEVAKRSIAYYFSNKVAKKVIRIDPAIHISKNLLTLKKKHKNVNFLFMGSINNPDEFYIKGGLEALETFSLLRKKYDNINMIMRCKLPEEIKNKYDFTNITLLENQLSTEKIAKIYSDSDILIMPGYSYFIMAYLEAFSYGLPIIALDTFGVSEFIKNGKNGFYVKPSKDIPINRPEYPSNMRSKYFIEKIKEHDPRVIKRLADSASKIIENPELLSRMSKQCFKLSRTTYSYNRNLKNLQKIFDEALK